MFIEQRSDLVLVGGFDLLGKTTPVLALTAKTPSPSGEGYNVGEFVLEMGWAPCVFIAVWSRHIA
jgi:hypothetical protein